MVTRCVAPFFTWTILILGGSGAPAPKTSSLNSEEKKNTLPFPCVSGLGNRNAAAWTSHELLVEPHVKTVVPSVSVVVFT
jgi:hypothetical protein